MQAIPFNQYLKENCRTTHDSVDELVMSVKPFDNTENYIRFLQLQAVFHKIVDDIYKNPQLNEKITGLAELARYDDVILDLQDLNAAEKAGLLHSYSELTKIRTRRRAADSTDSTARRDNAVLV